MTARTNSSRQGGGADRGSGSTAQRPDAAPSRSLPLLVAVALAGLAALLRTVGQYLPAVDPVQPPGFHAAALHLALALLPLVLVLALLGRGHPDAAARVVLIGALFAPGELLSDLQLGVDPGGGSRPDLTLPMSLTPVVPGIGLWLLLAGHLAAIAAGIAALLAGRAGGAEYRPALREPGASTGAAGPVAGHPGTSAGDSAGGQGGVPVALSLGVLAGIALLLSEPFETTSLFQLARSPLEQPLLPGFVGGVLLVLAAPLAAAIAASAGDVPARRAGALACALALAAVSLPQLLSGALLPGFTPAWGPPVVLGCAVLLLALGLFGGRGSPEAGAEVHLPGSYRLNLATGLLGVFTGGCCVLSGLLGLVGLPAGLPVVPSYADRLLLPAGSLVAVASAVLLFGVLAPPVARPGELPRPSRIPPAVRPTLLVVLVVVPFAGTTALDGALAVSEVPGARVGFGVALALLALIGTLAAAVTGALAGGQEREDVDLSERSVRTPMLGVAVPAGLLAIGAFGLPVLTGPGYSGPALSGEFSLGWWGLAVSLVAVLAAVGLGTSSRPARACALLVGAALVLAFRALELPLTVDRVRGGTAAPGLWCAVAGGVVLLAGAALAVLLRAGAPARDGSAGTPESGVIAS